MNESWIPDGFHTITPNIIVDDAEGAISFFEEAFGATERYRLTMGEREDRALRAQLRELRRQPWGIRGWMAGA